MSQNKVYSPTQAALGSFIGGPIASVYFVFQNYHAINKAELASKALTFGGAIVVFLVALLPFLPDDFPNMVIPLVTVVLTRVMVEKYQFDRKTIVEDENLNFHSGWRVFIIGVISFCLFIVSAMSFLILMDLLGFGQVA